MMTWRERVAAAAERQRGRRWYSILHWEPVFRKDDYQAWLRLETCPAGEAIERYGLTDVEACKRLIRLGNLFGTLMFHGDIAGADRLLDVIDDTALMLKREQGR